MSLTRLRSSAIELSVYLATFHQGEAERLQNDLLTIIHEQNDRILNPRSR
ncbi:hypothetical protein SAMN05444166_1033 [Singulisphaera sp. GP187]|nr:hypothetical protein [Singulisphaera sp. GP187]SIN81298.1 hypothetical protein SAMN05444166_1033 [Singulisphaera sp. GP187]